MISSLDIWSFWTKVYQTFFTECRRNRGRWSIRLILNIFIRFGDIHCWSLKLFEVGSNFACFWPVKFFSGKLPKFLMCVIKFGLLLIIMQNFIAIGQRSSEIIWQNKKTSAVKHKSAPKTIVSGRPKKLKNVGIAWRWPCSVFEKSV